MAEPVQQDEERLVFVESALAGLRESSPFALAAARGLLGERELTTREARIRLTAERGVLREAAKSAPAPAQQAGGDDFEQQHPRGAGEQGGQFVRKGEQGPRVAALHARLAELGHAAPTHDKYDAKTQASVMEFQKRYGLPQTGVVDAPTLEAMRTPPQLTQADAHAELRTAMQTAGKAVGPGDAGPNVASLQQSLGALGFQVTDQPQEYGTSTQLAVRQVQKQNGFAPTGRADEQTLALIARLAAAAARPTTGAVAGTQEQQGGNIAGDQLATWGLKKQAATRRKGGRPAPDPRARPRGNSNRQKAGATSTKGGKVNEASYDGNPSVAGSPSSMASFPWGGVNPMIAKAASLLGPMKPPNLREAAADAFEACASCVFFGGGSTGCERYGGYPVDRDDLCDTWKTMTPAQDRPTVKEFEGEAEVGTGELGEAATAKSRVLSEVKSSAYPGLDRSPKQNWVDKAGGLPSYIERIAKHLHYEQGKDIGRSIQIAVGVVKRWCAGGSASARGGASASHVTAATRAKACAAVAEWNAKRAKSKAKTAQEAANDWPLVGSVTFEEAVADMDLAVALAEADGQPIPPSERYAARILAAVEAEHDDWDRWGADGSPPPEPEEADPLVVFAQDDAFALAEGDGDLSLDPFVREVRGKHALYVAGVPVRIIESPAQALVVEAAARAFVTSMRANPKQMRERAAHQLRGLKGGLHRQASKLPRADAAVHTVVSSKFAGKGAKPRTLATDVGRATAAQEGDSLPDSAAGDVEGSALAEGVVGFLDSKHPRLPKGRKGGGEFEKVIGRIDGDARQGAGLSQAEREFVGRVNGGGGQKTPGKAAAHDALTVDQAIGGVLHSFPGLSDWSVDKHGDDWLVQVTMPDGEHHFRITDAGKVTLANADGSEKKPAAAAAAQAETHGGGYELSGDTEQPYHMEDGQVFKGKKGGWFRKVEHGTMVSAKGWKGAGVHVEDLQTGEKKWVPSFTMKQQYELAAAPGAAKPQKPDDDALFGDLMDSVKGGAAEAGAIKKLAANVPHGGYMAAEATPGAYDALAALDDLPAEHFAHLSAADLEKIGDTAEDVNYHALAAKARAAIKGQGSSGGGLSLAGKNVVVTGKIPGYTRPAVHGLIAQKGGNAQDAVTGATHILITGEKVGKAKPAAAAKNGVQVVTWDEVKHLLEAGLSGTALRALRTRCEIAEATDAGDDAALRARLRVLEGRLDGADLRSYRAATGDRLALLGVSETTARVHGA